MGARRSRTRTLGLLAAVPPTLGMLGPPATTEPPQVPDAKLVLVLDASASMVEADASGGTRIDAVRTVLSDLIGDFGPGEPIGFRVYGATVAGADAPGACEDSQMLVPIGRDNRGALEDAVQESAPLGQRPIGYALREAAGDLGTEGQRSILLVAHGESNCDPDPCTAARDLAAGDINLTINVVGLNATPAARTQLQCVADAGHGTYFDAQDVPSLASAMERLASRAFRPPAVAGTPVVGTPTADGAPELAPDGQYTDRVGAADAWRNYLVRRTRPGSSIHVGFTAPLGHIPKRDDESRGNVEFWIGTLDGEQCANTLAFPVEGPWPVLTGQASVWADPDNLASPCLDDDVLVLSVNPAGFGDEIVGALFELVIREERLVTAGALIQDSAEPGQVQWQAMPADGVDGEVTGGSSFNDATPVAPGSYTTDILPGETALFRIPLEWGELLQAQADFAKPAPAPVVDDDDAQPTEVSMALISPNRGDVTEYTMVGTGATNANWLDSDRATRVATATVPIRWWNRDEDLYAFVPGDYYVAISVAADVNGKSVVLPFTLTLGVFGTAGQGAPPYVEGGRADDEGVSPLLVGAFGIAGIGLVGRGAYLLRRNARTSR